MIDERDRDDIALLRPMALAQKIRKAVLGKHGEHGLLYRICASLRAPSPKT